MPRHPAAAWIDAHWRELRDFDQQWIAVSEQNAIVAHGENIQELIQRVDERGFDRRQIVFSFVDFGIKA